MKVAFANAHHLRLALEPPKRGRVDDARSIALILCSNVLWSTLVFCVSPRYEEYGIVALHDVPHVIGLAAG
jgi:hypothetical protein